MPRGFAAPVFTAVLLLSPLALAQEAPRAITPSEFEAVGGGEVLIDAVRGDINRGQVIGLVNGPIDAISEIVRDADTHEEWFPDTQESAFVSGGDDDETHVLQGRTHLPLLRDRYWQLNGTHYHATFDGVACEIVTYDYDHSYEEGNMDDLFGYWMLCPYEGKTVVKYVINADLGVWLPGPVVTWAQRRMLPGIIEGLNREYEERY